MNGDQLLEMYIIKVHVSFSSEELDPFHKFPVGKRKTAASRERQINPVLRHILWSIEAFAYYASSNS